jgi:hypothetical protein
VLVQTRAGCIAKWPVGEDLRETGHGRTGLNHPLAFPLTGVPIDLTHVPEGDSHPVVGAGVHVGEVDLVGSAVEGLAVHEAARIISAAGAQEILTSEITRSLPASSGIEVQERGVHRLKGLPGEHRLFAYASE